MAVALPILPSALLRCVLSVSSLVSDPRCSLLVAFLAHLSSRGAPYRSSTIEWTSVSWRGRVLPAGDGSASAFAFPSLLGRIAICMQLTSLCWARVVRCWHYFILVQTRMVYWNFPASPWCGRFVLCLGLGFHRRRFCPHSLFRLVAIIAFGDDFRLSARCLLRASLSLCWLRVVPL